MRRKKKKKKNSGRRVFALTIRCKQLTKEEEEEKRERGRKVFALALMFTSTHIYISDVQIGFG